MTSICVALAPIQLLPMELISAIGENLSFRDRDAATRANSCFFNIHGRHTTHTWKMAPLPENVTLLSRLNLLLCRKPQLEELEIFLDIKKAGVLTMQPWDWAPISELFGTIERARCKIKLSMPDGVASVENESAFLRLMLRPLALMMNRIDITIASLAVTTGDACVEILSSGLNINRLFIVRPENEKLNVIKDALVLATDAKQIKKLSIVFRQGHGQYMSWSCQKFVKLIKATPYFNCQSYFAGFPENVGIASMLCDTVHICDRIAFDNESLEILSSVASSSNKQDSRIKYLCFNEAPSNELMRYPRLMNEIRRVKESVSIVISDDSFDSGSTAFIMRMISGSTGRTIGASWPQKQEAPLVYARAQITIIRTVRAMKRMRLSAKEADRLFLTDGCKFVDLESEETLLAMLPEDERALYMF
jgi:hypothetical protein